MTTQEAELILYELFNFRTNACITGVSWGKGVPLKFEVDFLTITPAGYATGIEIKVSMADLLKDKNKPHIKDFGGESFKGLSYFYYAVPSKLIDETIKQVPPECGIINLDTKQPVRSAGKLYSWTSAYKWSTDELLSIHRLNTMRVYALKKKLNSVVNNK